MGYYIPGPAKGKVGMLMKEYGAHWLIPEEMPISYEDIPKDKAIVVVIENSAFEAAALCYNSGEFEDLINFDIVDDPRPRVFLIMDKAKAYELAGYHG